MTRIKLIIILLILPVAISWAQKVTLNPSVTPTFLFRYNDQVTVTYDVAGTSLASLTNCMGLGLDSKYNDCCTIRC